MRPSFGGKGLELNKPKRESESEEASKSSTSKNNPDDEGNSSPESPVGAATY